MDACALPYAAKIYSQHKQTRFVECTRRAKYDLVVHSAAPEWVRMKHQRNSRARAVTRFLEDRLKLAVRYRNDEIADWVHYAKRNTRSEAVASARSRFAGSDQVTRWD